MTLIETTEIFSILMLAYPNAEMFKGGIQKLAPTIKLWTQCLGDVDFWTAQQAAYRLCRKCKFPPSIAEFREESNSVLSDLNSEIQNAFQQLKLLDNLYGRDELCSHLGKKLLAVVNAMGGVQCLVVTTEYNGEKHSMWNIEAFTRAYESFVRSTTVLPQINQKQIGERKL